VPSNLSDRNGYPSPDVDDIEEKKKRTGIPVPWLFTLAYLIGVCLEFLVPVKLGFTSFLDEVVISLGAALIFLGAMLMIWPQYIFRKHRTTTVPTGTTTTFVNWGPYRLSRNPMYLGLFSFFTGLSLLFVSIWSIACLVGVMIYVNSKIIPIEERQLAKNFGKIYEDYCRKVKRWI